MNDTTGRGRRQLLGMFAIALVALGGAYTLYYLASSDGVWRTTNHGSFVEPPMTVEGLRLSDGEGAPLDQGGSWWLFTVARAGCAVECLDALHQLRQLHVLLNRDAERVRRALLTDDDRNVAGVLGDYPALLHLTGDLDGLADGIYIVDPLGNLVLFYALEQAGEPVLEDLKRLLKLSRIG